MANTTYQFKFNWFEKNINLWHEYCSSFQKRVVKIVEKGAFEGASTTWLLDNILHYKNSRLVTIDNFCGGEGVVEGVIPNSYHFLLKSPHSFTQ